MTDKRTSYFNTLIFTIVAAIVSVLLLLLLLIKKMKQFAPFIITLEVGIFTVILWCVVIIWINAKDYDKRKNNATSVKFDKCPDYYLQVNESDKIMCKNQYLYTDQNGSKYKMVIYPVNANRSLPKNLTTTLQKPTNLDSFELSTIETSSDLKTSKDKCGVLYKDNTGKFKDYNNLPWNTMRSKCASLYN